MPVEKVDRQRWTHKRSAISYTYTTGKIGEGYVAMNIIKIMNIVIHGEHLLTSQFLYRITYDIHFTNQRDFCCASLSNRAPWDNLLYILLSLLSFETQSIYRGVKSRRWTCTIHWPTHTLACIHSHVHSVHLSIAYHNLFQLTQMVCMGGCRIPHDSGITAIWRTHTRTYVL